MLCIYIGVCNIQLNFAVFWNQRLLHKLSDRPDSTNKKPKLRFQTGPTVVISEPAPIYAWWTSAGDEPGGNQPGQQINLGTSWTGTCHEQGQGNLPQLLLMPGPVPLVPIFGRVNWVPAWLGLLHLGPGIDLGIHQGMGWGSLRWSWGLIERRLDVVWYCRGIMSLFWCTALADSIPYSSWCSLTCWRNLTIGSFLTFLGFPTSKLCGRNSAAMEACPDQPALIAQMLHQLHYLIEKQGWNQTWGQPWLLKTHPGCII